MIERVPLRFRGLYWTWFVFGTVLLILLIPLLPEPYRGPQVLFSGVGAIWALAFYVQGRHAEDARFMKSLLTDFNGRYDKLNDDLQSAIWREGPFTVEVKLKFVDYFNLCAEEWLFRQAGYIYDPVWDAWQNGMLQYLKDPRVKELWNGERESNSYYGFEFPSA